MSGPAIAAEQPIPATAPLPAWDLSDLYGAMDDPRIHSDLEDAKARAKTFFDTYKGKLASLSGADLGKAIKAYETLQDTLGRVMSYGQLLFAADVSDSEVGRFYQTLQERVTDIEGDMLFFNLELNLIEEEVINRQLQDPAAQHFEPWIRESRLFRPHQLDETLEKYIHDKSVAGRGAWSRLFDETMAGLRLDVDGEELTLSEALNRLSDTNQAVRKAAGKGLGKGLEANARLFALITNTLAKDKEIEDRWRNYHHPVAFRNRVNQVEDEVVEALVQTVKQSYEDLAHRYYQLKAHWFGVEKMDYWDRNAPLPDADDKRYSWDEAKALVLNAYGDFTPEMAEIAERFFTGSWIDAAPRAGKDSGAFSHPTVPSAHPYILMNFHGRARDVMTLAHELGHGVHQVLSARQGALMADTPLTLAETASVFGEMLTFRAILKAEPDPKRRRFLIAGKVEDMMNTVVRQIAFHEFEHRVHHERRNGELSIDQINRIWLDVQTESLGPAFRFDDEYKYYWAYIPHFIHSPFYVYAYAFGDCLVNSLYAVYAGAHPGFQQKYLEMLSAGGTLKHKEMLAPFGLDASDPGFWRRGIGLVTDLIDELESLS